MTGDDLSSISLPRKAATATNGVVEARQKADDAIKAQFDLLKRSEGALTVVGSIMAQACVDGVYPPDPQLAAIEAYKLCSGLDKSPIKSERAQISKLSNFAAVALGWERKGIKLIKALVKRTEGLSKRYHIVQTVLVRLKGRRQGTMPSTAELSEMLKDAQASKPNKERKPKATDVSTSIRALDDLLAADTPAPILEAWALVKDHAAQKAAADLTPGVKS